MLFFDQLQHPAAELKLCLDFGQCLLRLLYCLLRQWV